MIDTDHKDIATMTSKENAPYLPKQTKDCTSSRIGNSTKKALTSEITGLEISPAGVLSSFPGSSQVIDAIGFLEQEERGLPFENKKNTVDMDNQDAKEKRRRNELLLDNFDSIVRTIYGYESRLKGNCTTAPDDSDSDCESDYEDVDDE